VESDPTRMCELLVGLPEVSVLGVVDEPGLPLVVHIEQAGDRPSCTGCGTSPVVKERDVVELVDLPAFGRPARLIWHKVRWVCPDPHCALMSWTWTDPRIAAPGDDRPGRAVGDGPGRSSRPTGGRGGERARL
jgi:transposase